MNGDSNPKFLLSVPLVHLFPSSRSLQPQGLFFGLVGQPGFSLAGGALEWVGTSADW